MTMGRPKLSKAVHSARLASSNELSGLLDIQDGSNIEVFRAEDVPSWLREALWERTREMFSTMHSTTSLGWEPVAEKIRLFNKLMRFIVIFADDHSTVIAFAVFRFNEERSERVIYCYQMNVNGAPESEDYCTRLLNLLDVIARETSMEKVKILVLKEHEDTWSDYIRIGFVQDSRPSVDDDADYVILSREIHQTGPRRHQPDESRAPRKRRKVTTRKTSQYNLRHRLAFGRRSPLPVSEERMPPCNGTLPASRLGNSLGLIRSHTLVNTSLVRGEAMEIDDDEPEQNSEITSLSSDDEEDREAARMQAKLQRLKKVMKKRRLENLKLKYEVCKADLSDLQVENAALRETLQRCNTQRQRRG